MIASLSSEWTAWVRCSMAEFKCAGTKVLALPAIKIFSRRVCSCRVRSYCSSGVKISSNSFSPGRIPVNAISIVFSDFQSRQRNQVSGNVYNLDRFAHIQHKHFAADSQVKQAYQLTAVFFWSQAVNSSGSLK